MTTRDPELTSLLVLELGRHLAILEREPPDLDEGPRSLHALKGSAGLAGEADFAAAIARLERRAREPDILREAGHRSTSERSHIS